MADNNGLWRAALIFLSTIALLVVISMYDSKKKVATAGETFAPSVVQQTMGVMPAGRDVVFDEAIPAPASTAGLFPENDTFVDEEWKIGAAEAGGNGDFASVDFGPMCTAAGCPPRDKLVASDLLPGDANSMWAQNSPAGTGDAKDVNYLNAGFHIGANTVGASMKNPSYDLRSEPANPRQQVSPWMQSTYEPLPRRKLEE